MGGSSRRCGWTHTLKGVVMVAACALMMTSCASASYQTAAMEASEGGDQKAATSLAKKEVARFFTPNQCSRTTSLNCGTLALAYGTLAGYHILDGDRTSGEGSFTPNGRSISTAIGGNSDQLLAVHSHASEQLGPAQTHPQRQSTVRGRTG